MNDRDRLEQLDEGTIAPYTLGDLELKNRTVMAPLTRTRAANEGKAPNELMAEYYAQRAGAGLILTEGTFVGEQGQGWYGAGSLTEEQRAGWERVCPDAVHGATGGLIFVQLWHQGSVSHRSFYSDGRLPLGPSAVNPEQPRSRQGQQDHERNPAPRWHFTEINQAVKDFRHAPHRSHETQSFDGVQIQEADLSTCSSTQFLQEFTNRRTDCCTARTSREPRPHFV